MRTNGPIGAIRIKKGAQSSGHSIAFAVNRPAGVRLERAVGPPFSARALSFVACCYRGAFSEEPLRAPDLILRNVQRRVAVESFGFLPAFVRWTDGRAASGQPGGGAVGFFHDHNERPAIPRGRRAVGFYDSRELGGFLSSRRAPSRSFTRLKSAFRRLLPIGRRRRSDRSARSNTPNDVVFPPLCALHSAARRPPDSRWKCGA